MNPKRPSSPSRPCPPPAEPAPAGAPAELVAWLEGLPEPHILFDRRYRIAAANEAYRSRFGDGGPVVGRTCHAVSHHIDVPCDRAGESCPLSRALTSGRRERVLHLHHTPAGQAYVDIELVPLRGADGEVAWFVEKMEPLPGMNGEAGPDAAGGLVGPPALIGRSEPMRQLLERVARVAPSRASVLLLGESGTGKELVARAVHEASPRAGRPLVVVDCASLPETLFESELFGHEKGAFTGAQLARAGLVEAAAGGTLFLDEVGDIPLPMQVKLLRLLEGGTFRRVGSNELRRADVRVIAATHRDLAGLVASGRFREDLLHRIASFPIRLPPLRERRDDIPLLAEALLARVAPGRARRLDVRALQRLQAHPFPGNVRELRNVLERAALLCDDAVIDAGAVEEALAMGAALAGPPAEPVGSTGTQPLRELQRRQRDELLREALARHGGSREALARELGMSLRTLYRRLRELRPPPAEAGPPAA